MPTRKQFFFLKSAWIYITCSVVTGLFREHWTNVDPVLFPGSFGHQVEKHYLGCASVGALTRSARYTDPMLVQCWAIVSDASPTLNQHRVSVSFVRGRCHHNTLTMLTILPITSTAVVVIVVSSFILSADQTTVIENKTGVQTSRLKIFRLK